MKLHGLIPPTITPLREDGEIDVDAIGRLTDYLLSGGADGLFVLGTCGEGPSLTRRQRRDAVDAFVDSCAGRVPVLAGIAETSAARGEEAVGDVAEAGADVVVISTPYHLASVGERAVAAHISRLARATELPAVVYNIPVNTQNPVTPAVLDEVAALPQVIALKESSGDWEAFQALSQVARDHGLAVLQGAERLISRSVLAGADGAVPGVANLVPSLARDLIDCAARGDASGAEALQERLNRVCAIQTTGFWLSALKNAANRLNLCGPTLASGMPGLTTAEEDELSILMPSVYEEAQRSA